MGEKEFSQLLEASRIGDVSARQQLIPAMYKELRELARSHLRRENIGHTLQATALVHEVYLKLAGRNRIPQNRTHFLALSAQTMRRILIDHARAKRRDRRGGDRIKITLTDWEQGASVCEQELLELHDALEKLSRFDERAAKVVELTYFGGLSYEEIADVLQVGRSTVYEDLKVAKAWLAVAMNSV